MTTLESTGAREPETLGLIGLGLMGMALAERFLGAGFRVLGWDMAPAPCQTLVKLGGTAGTSAAHVLTACRRVVLSLPTLDIVAQVLARANDALSDGLVLLDTTTGGPPQAQALGSRLAGRGVAYLDATVSGSSAQVRAGEVTVMVGGPKEAVQQCQDLFCCFARQVIHIGPSGSGAKMKLVTNLVLGLNRAALAEGLVLARALGLDLAQTLTVLRESMAYSRIIDTKGQKMITGDFAPQGKLSQHLKDVRLILEAGASAGLKLPLSLAHRDLLELAEAAGFGQLDNSAVIQAYQPGQPPGEGTDAR